MTGSKLKNKKFPEVISGIIKDRTFSLIIIILPFILITANILKIEIWKCPFNLVFKMDCPGCGLTRAAVSLLKLNIVEAHNYHPFILFFLSGWLLVAVCFFLPVRYREKISAVIRYLEYKTGFGIIFFVSLAAFGIIRNL